MNLLNYRLARKNTDIFATIDNKNARCKVCNIHLHAQHADLIKHINRIVYKQNMNKLNLHVQQKLTNYDEYLFIFILYNINTTHIHEYFLNWEVEKLCKK